MLSVGEKSSEQLLREAIREALVHPRREMLMASIQAGISHDPELLEVAKQELAPSAAELELHLTGDDVVGHSANAKAFATFVLAMAETAKEYAKGLMHVKALSSQIRVAPGPGSVRATFMAPPKTLSSSSGDIAIPVRSVVEPPVWTESDVYSDSLWAIATVLSNSDPDSPNSEALDGAIQGLPAKARVQLRKVAEQVVTSGWQIDGDFRRYGSGSHEVHLNHRAAVFLSSRLAIEEIEKQTWTTTGILRGHRWDTGLMYFTPDSRGRALPASFETSDLEQRVAALASVEDRPVTATFSVFISHGRGSDEGRSSYVLTSVVPIEEQPAIAGFEST